ncbi:TonB-dependent receptor plug domain-containing protein [Pseudoduganella sp. UC29_106]|uniref:TonB-dependent receptor plug domain-containing protein n=1 Tax=Pseudoduganella sp. UC29_106 TaxID=3374553 RepID=UPI0037569813
MRAPSAARIIHESHGVILIKHPSLKQGALAIILAFGASDLALAQQAATQPTATVYVTGSNLKRTAKETTSVVQTITAQDIKDTGAATVQELMKLIPAMGSDGNFDTTDGGFARGASTASLRGLTSTSTLVLLNGRRMTPGAYADPNDGNSTMYDLNSIPVSAIDRVEVAEGRRVRHLRFRRHRRRDQLHYQVQLQGRGNCRPLRRQR